MCKRAFFDICCKSSNCANSIFSVNKQLFPVFLNICFFSPSKWRIKHRDYTESACQTKQKQQY